MPHSMPIAEPPGAIVGIVSGLLGSYLGKMAAEKLDLPEWVGSIEGAVAGHYLGAIVTKGLVNVGLIDPLGFGINVTVTSPATALAHGLMQAIFDVFPNFSKEEVEGLVAATFSSPEVQAEISAIPVNEPLTRKPSFEEFTQDD